MIHFNQFLKFVKSFLDILRYIKLCHNIEGYNTFVAFNWLLKKVELYIEEYVFLGWKEEEFQTKVVGSKCIFERAVMIREKLFLYFVTTNTSAIFCSHLS